MHLTVRVLAAQLARRRPARGHSPSRLPDAHGAVAGGEYVSEPAQRKAAIAPRGNQGEPLRDMRAERMARKARVDGAASRKRRWARQQAREPSVALPQLPLADRQLLRARAAQASGCRGCLAAALRDLAADSHALL